jgi:3-hydroxymyristoyl/3-hydroxydecanoyl-(acyl carrier protein) dehydratase
MSSNDLTTLEERIASRIDPLMASGLPVSVNASGMAFSNMAQVFEFAKMMAIGGIAVRKHLRGNPGACLAVTIQAIEWRMSPFAVANKSYSVNDQLAYEAQLIHAVSPSAGTSCQTRRAP